MPGVNTPLTEREKCAIFAYKYGILPDLKTAYLCADEKTTKELLNQVGLKSRVSAWSNSEKFKQYAEYCTRLIADKESNAVKRGKDEILQELQRGENPRGESESPKTQPAKAVTNSVDYSDPANQMRKLNDLVNTADDSGEALDALKVIISTQKADKEAARERKTVVFFTPVKCLDCQMYQKAKARQEKG